MQSLRQQLHMLRWLDEWEPLDPARCWSECVRRDFRSFSGDRRTAWRALLKHLRGNAPVRMPAGWARQAPATNRMCAAEGASSVFAVPAQEIPSAFSDVVAFLPIHLRHHANFADVLLKFCLRFPHIGSDQVPYGPKLSSDEETHATNLCGHRIRLGTQQVSGNRFTFLFETVDRFNQ